MGNPVPVAECVRIAHSVISAGSRSARRSFVDSGAATGVYVGEGKDRRGHAFFRIVREKRQWMNFRLLAYR
jgi:hypothetical protein